MERRQATVHPKSVAEDAIALLTATISADYEAYDQVLSSSHKRTELIWFLTDIAAGTLQALSLVDGEPVQTKLQRFGLNVARVGNGH
jgi:hypothetical protein